MTHGVSPGRKLLRITVLDTTMTDRVTHYDYIHGVLAGTNVLASEPMYATVKVKAGQEKDATHLIHACDGYVTGVNEHESGVSITFEARNVSYDTT